MVCAVLLLVAAGGRAWAQQVGYTLNGRVIDRLSREPVSYAAVVVVGQE